MNETRILSRPVEVAEIPATGLDVEVVASAGQCAALAAGYDLVAVKGLSATLTLSRDGNGVVTVSGRVAGDIVQTCVVSLVSVDEHIDEPVFVRYVAAGSPEGPEPPKPGAEVMINPERPDPPEILTGPAIDLGALAEEHFVLAIDPYPRAPGAILPAGTAQAGDEDGDSPFAVLAELAERPPPKR